MSAQTDYPFPWNPDADLDGWVSTEDLLQLLTVFETEFQPDSWETDSISAAVVLDGNHNYFQCQNYCNDIEGNWRMADLDAFGRHFDLASDVSAHFWVNGNDKLNSSDFAYDTYQIFGSTGDMANVSVSNFSQDRKCMCYIRSSPFVPNQYTGDSNLALWDLVSDLQGQVDSLQTQFYEAESNGSTNDSVQTASSEFVLQCVDLGVAPLCTEGSAVVPETSSNDYSYSLDTFGSSTVTTNTVSPNWRKFCLSSESYSEDTLAISLKSEKYDNDDGGSWTPSLGDLILDKNLDGAYCFYLYARGSSTSACTANWDVNEFFADAPAIQAKGYSSACYCSWTWKHIEILLRENGFHVNSGIRFGIE